MENEIVLQAVIFALKTIKTKNYEVPQLSVQPWAEEKNSGRPKKRQRICWAYPSSSEYFDKIWRDYNDEQFFKKYRMGRMVFQFICDQLKDSKNLINCSLI